MAALFSIGLWNSSGRGDRLAFIPQKPLQVWQKEKLWKLPFCCFCSSKKLDGLPLLWMHVCPKDSDCTALCPGYFVNREKISVPHRFPSRVRTASFPLVGDLSLQVLEWMEEMADLVSTGCAQESIHGPDVSFSLPSLFWSSSDTVWQVSQLPALKTEGLTGSFF